MVQIYQFGKNCQKYHDLNPFFLNQRNGSLHDPFQEGDREVFICEIWLTQFYRLSEQIVFSDYSRVSPISLVYLYQHAETRVMNVFIGIIISKR